jgi:hypothetical protein
MAVVVVMFSKEWHTASTSMSQRLFRSENVLKFEI